MAKMKIILLSLLCTLTVSLTSAQSRFGIINYTLPNGWYARQAGNDMELVKKGAENSCKITFFQELNSVVKGEKQFAELWALKTKSGNAKIKETIPPVKTEEDDWISYSASKGINSKPPYTEGFYTLSDGSKTAIILAEAQGNLCIDEMNSILASINIPEKETKTTTKSKKAKRVRIAALKSLKGMVN
jgi:hypothetical protein